jgi:Fic family protein
VGTKSNSDWTDLRPYAESHPWLCFAFHAKSLPPDLLVQLGGVASRCKVLGTVWLSPNLAEELHLIYLSRGVHGTTAIEGNTLSEEEVRRHIEKKASLPRSKQELEREIDNVAEAYNLIVDQHVSRKWDTSLGVDKIKQFNGMVLREIPLDPKIVPGEVRTYHVGVSDYIPPAGKWCSELLERLCIWLNTLEPLNNQEHPIANAILKSIIGHIYIAWIHPFGDGNGRTARLLEFELLIAAGVPAIASHLLSDHYNKTRNEYLRELSKSSKSGGDMVSFIQYALQGLHDGLTEQFQRIESWQTIATWREHVHSSFRNETGAAATRRRQLALAIGDHPNGVAKRDLWQLTPELAALYAVKTPKALSRDLGALNAMGLAQTIGPMVFPAKGNMPATRSQKRVD